ncbi:DUF1553 domain-containing protein [Membranihabitans marinus]|uniref:DUF1553 domain-containing protein n=1 Tax=Membranihabitans marinus TaxID=1227546 RepID=UPI001F3234CF|nr:DUF1553 domain-containing protein [Membranihabitans marinus]
MLKKGMGFAMVFLLGLQGCKSPLPEELVEASVDIPDNIDFNYDVKPILSDKCFSCHGPDLDGLKGDLRLDIAESAYSALGDHGDRYAIVPGKLSKSELFHRIISDDEEVMMPPPNSNLVLTDREKAILSRWIEQGAEYKDHWSFIPPSMPDIEDCPSETSTIDYLVQQEWYSQGLQPNPRADKETLIRRLSFDLTGLPPSLEEVDEFLADDDPEAYETLVDRLLARPAYGERMAAIWMDVARYADSDGYLDDKHRSFSPWRDWVIHAYNSNMPYNEFVTWQLAGDLIPDSHKESILATAFNRLHKRNTEAGIDFEEFRVEYVADRVQTLSTGIMGLSVQCARCHDHKYDEISQKDYYKMFGMFNSTHEVGSPAYGPDQTPGPALLLTDETQDSLIAFLHQETSKLEGELKQVREKSDEKISQWLGSKNDDQLLNEVKRNISRSLTDHYPLDGYQKSSNGTFSLNNDLVASRSGTVSDPIFRPGVKGNAFFVNEFNTVSLGDKVGWFERTEPFTLDYWLYPDTVYEEVGVIYHCEDLRLGLKGYSMFLKDNRLQFIMAHSFPQNAIVLETLEALMPKKWHHITVTYDGGSKARGVQLYLDGKPMETKTIEDNLYKGILFQPDIHTYGFKGITLGNRPHILPLLHGGIDEVKVYNEALSAMEVRCAHDENETMAYLKSLSDGEKVSYVKDYYWNVKAEDVGEIKQRLRDERRKENEVLNEVSEIMVLGDLPEPRPTYVLDRGVFDQHAEEVEPGVPEAVYPYDSSLPKNRLGLTQWLFDPNHPLTSRVYVNRLWQMFFGKGIVETSEDFGNQGKLPSHPELLDYLAVRFVELGWDVKKLQKEIVMSEVYQLASNVSQEGLEKDPENIYLARGSRFRLPAEMIRDNALASSGLLVERIGGESTYPYQPAGLWDELSNKSWRYQYLQEPGEGLYRRSLYTIWKRTAPPPSMLIFDAPERGECKVRRQTTSTPLQALVLLNDPQYVEANRALAASVLEEYPNDTVEQIQQIFRSITGRRPISVEENLLSRFLEEEIQRFKENPKDRDDYLTVGEYRIDSDLDANQLAALATIAHSIMNTDEGYTRK